jgi:outer membrane protein
MVLRTAGRPAAILFISAGTLGLMTGCLGTPSISGMRGIPPAPDEPWVAPAAVRQAPSRSPRDIPGAGVPADLAARIRGLTLEEAIDLALRNNPATRLSWASARAAAAAYASQRGDYVPTVDGELSVTRLKTGGTQGRAAVEQTLYGPSVILSYLLFDFGGRAGAVEGARQALIAANWTHNATIQNTVLQVALAYFDYVANQALLEAQAASVRDAETNLAAAEERRRVGLATIADVLQARTALSQVRLSLETTRGNLQTARGALALSMGLPADVPYDVEAPPPDVPIAGVADSVESLIAKAVETRPDLAAMRAEAAQARAEVRQTRAARFPSLLLDGTGSRTYLSTLPEGTTNYNVQLGLRIPLFDGFSRVWDQRQAQALEEVAAARAESLERDVTFEVFRSYHLLETATRRVMAAEDLLASAEQSEEVAAGRYRAGVGTILDLLVAQSALADARAQQVQARWSWHAALAQLAHDAGVLDERGGSPIPLAPEPTGPPEPRID